MHFNLNNFPTFLTKITTVPRMLFCSCVSYASNVENYVILQMEAKIIPETQCISNIETVPNTIFA